MAPMASSSSDDIMNLPRVPRVRRGSGKASTNGTASEEAPAKTVKAKDQRFGNSKRNPRDSSSRERGKRKRITESVHSDEDENEEDESEDNPPLRRTKRQPRRTLQVRKVVVEEDEDDDDELDEEEKEDSESDSPTPPPAKKKEKRVKEMSSDSNSKEEDEGDEEDEEVDEESEDTKKVNAGREKFLAELEEAEDMDEGSDPLDSDDSDDIEKQTEKKTERLTRRQRAMQGENVELEFTKLESPKSKKAPLPEEEWSNDEEAELKKQQRARLRQMIHEKRNKEKRAAMVDKVLRGVTSKRKKLTMATEERVAKVGTRLSRNEMREGCIRFVSNPSGTSLSIPQENDAPTYLQASIKAMYPRPCTRDPRTGKRIFADA